jgi:hypothetical protein
MGIFMTPEMISAAVAAFAAIVTVVGSVIAIIRRIDTNTNTLQQTITREIHNLDLKIVAIDTIVQPYAADIAELRKNQGNNTDRISHMEVKVEHAVASVDRLQRQLDALRAR